MKEHITPAEENLKADFNQYEAPLDLAAFDQFKAALDHQDKQNNTRKLTIIGLSVLIPLFLFLGITFGDFSKSVQEIGVNIGQADKESPTATLVDSYNDSKQTQDLVDLDQTENSHKGLQTIAIESSELQQSTTKTLGRNSSGLSDLVSNQSNEAFTQKSDVTELINNSTPTFNPTLSTIQSSGNLFTNRNAIANTGNRPNKSSSVGMTNLSIAENHAKSNIIQKGKTSISQRAENSLLINQTEINTLDFMPSLVSGFLSTQSKVGEYNFTLSELDYFRTHVYFGIEVGYTQARDFGSDDQFLKSHNRFGSQAKGIVGYQFSQISAIEFGYQQRKVSSSWEYQTFFANSQSFVNTHLLSVALQNSLPIFKSRWALTHKVGYMFGFGNLKSSDLNTSGDFIVSPLLNVPFRYKEDFIGVDSNVYHLLNGGLGLNYRLNYNFDIGINANYNFGLKPIRKSNVDYIYGEGLEGNYQGETRGKFVSLNLKVLYRMRS